jgi:antitoxin (DNA-binding transcriptional repressor) of toxin-antitoxin stability system
MMTSYTFSEARQKFAAVLDKAKKEGKVLIRRKDGSLFEIHPVPRKDSPLNVKGIRLGMSAGEIVGIIREFRER